MPVLVFTGFLFSQIAMSQIDFAAEVVTPEVSFSGPVAVVPAAQARAAVAAVAAPLPVPQSVLSFEAMLSVAERVAATEFVPTAMRGNPDKVLACILFGQEVGLGPMQSLSSIYIVEGRATMDANKQLALFQQQGGRSRWIEHTDKVATIELRLRGASFTSTFTIEQARRAGLADRPTWKRYPENMLRARAITNGLKAVGWAPAGALYDPEEIEAVAEAEREEKTQAAAPKVERVKRTKQTNDAIRAAIKELEAKGDAGVAAAQAFRAEAVSGTSGFELEEGALAMLARVRAAIAGLEADEPDVVVEEDDEEELPV